MEEEEDGGAEKDHPGHPRAALAIHFRDEVGNGDV